MSNEKVIRELDRTKGGKLAVEANKALEEFEAFLKVFEKSLYINKTK